MEAHRLAVILGEQDRQARAEWDALLSQAVAWLGPHWRLAEPGQANLHIVPVDGGAASLERWLRCARVHPLYRIVWAGSRAAPPEAEWRLPSAAGPGLPGLIDTVNLLLRVEENLARLTGAARRAAETYDFKAHIQSIAVEALFDRACRVCELGGVSLYLAPHENACYAPGDLERILPLCLARREDLNVESFAAGELAGRLNFADFSARLSKYAAVDGIGLPEGAGAKKTRRYPLDELLWFASLANSRGRSLAEYDYSLGHKLKALPAFAWDARYQAYHGLARFWQADYCGLAAVAALPQASARQAVDFHNACALLDWFEPKPQAGLAAAPAQTPAAAPRDEPPPPAPAQAEAQSNLVQFPPANAEKTPLSNSVDRLYKKLKQDSRKLGNKIIFAGMKGAGKSTAIATLGDCVRRTSGTSDESLLNQSKGMVSVSFAELHLKDMIMFVYGTPGHRRLEFMGQSLCENAWGLVMMVDNSAGQPLEELDYYLDLYHECSADMRVAIAVTHYDCCDSPGLEAYRQHIDKYHFSPPAWRLDPRDSQSMLDFLDKMANLEPMSPRRAWQAA